MQPPKVDDIVVLGVSHHQASIEVREKFSLPPSNDSTLSKEAKNHAKGLFIFNTCNRTEIYLHDADVPKVQELWQQICGLSSQEFLSFSYSKSGNQAVAHLFQVAAGLDSQILGDFEIAGQLKRSIDRAENEGLLNNVLRRLAEFALQASKKIKNQTGLSNGAASMSYTAAQFIKTTYNNLEEKQILLYGTGKIGSAACLNLLKHAPAENITLINRTFDSAKVLGSKHGIAVRKHIELKNQLQKADVVIVATSSDSPTISKDHLEDSGREKLLIDLSVPRNIDSSVENLANITLAHVDHLAELQSEVLAKRKASVPAANEILGEKAEEFYSWLKTRGLAPTFEAIKSGLEQIRLTEVDYHNPNLSAKERIKIEQITSRITDTIARRWIKHLKDNQDLPSDTATMIKELFDSKDNSIHES